MFRPSSKKRQRKAVTRLRKHGSDEENDESIKAISVETEKEEIESGSKLQKSVKIKKSKEKKKGLVVRSFEVDEGDDEDGEMHNDAKGEKKSGRKKLKKPGLVFGGLNIVDEEEEFVQVSDEKTSSPLYGQAALEKLRAEQKYKAPSDNSNDQEQKTSKEKYTVPTASRGTEQVFSKTRKSFHSNEKATTPTGSQEDYVPLDDNTPSTILTGDEAILFESRSNGLKTEEHDHFDTVMEDSNSFDGQISQEQIEESSAWETEITRRAGVRGENNTYQASTPMRKSETGQGTTTAMSLVKLRTQIQTTILHLETQEAHSERACQHRRVELAQTKEELERQQNDLEHAGKALEDYQRLREKFTCWTGALRDLKSKVQPIQEALIELDSEVADSSYWQSWEDDMCSVLYRAGLLDHVLGRKPPEAVFEDTITIMDEFGRDVKSQQAMHREKRTRRRLDVRKERPDSTEDQSDAFITESESSSFRQRLVALGQALDIGVEDLEDEYTCLPNLVKVFHDWRTSYPEDYNQCFANLSLADLASVLIQLHFCRLDRTKPNRQGWLEGWIAEAENGRNKNLELLFGWVKELSDTDAAMNGGQYPAPSNEVTSRVVEKVHLAMLTDILNKSSYNVVSKKQTRSLSAVYVRLSKLLNDPGCNQYHEGFVKVSDRIADYIKATLDNVTVVIMKNIDLDSILGDGDSIDESDSRYTKNEELRDVVRGVTFGQVHRLSKMMLNILIYWAPYLDFCSDYRGFKVFLLDFLCSKFLHLLSSLKGINGELASTSFFEVWTVLEKDWLKETDHMLYAAPLRAAAFAFKAA